MLQESPNLLGNLKNNSLSSEYNFTLTCAQLGIAVLFGKMMETTTYDLKIIKMLPDSGCIALCMWDTGWVFV